MLIACTHCNAALRVPDTAVDQRVKCPVCATIVSVLEAQRDSAAESTDVSPTPLPPMDPGAGTEVTASMPSSSSAKPPSRTSMSSASRDDVDEVDLDIRNLDRRADQPVNGMAMASMILGIVGAVSVFAACGCGLFLAIAPVCGVLAIVFGYLGNTPGSEGYARTGFICGIATLVLLAVVIVIVLVVVGFDLMRL